MYHYSEKFPLILDKTRINKVEHFFSTDSERIYKKNLKKYGETWEYYNTAIEYKFNSLGYRTKEISELHDDFMLTFGCSYTEGVGLSQSDVWPEQLSQIIKIDLYNAAKQATGMDFQFWNAMRWAQTNQPDPKLVIVQWPQKNRKRFSFTQKDESFILQDESYQRSIDGKWWTKRYIMDPAEMSMNILMWFEGFNNLWNLRNVPVLNFTWDNDLEQHLMPSKYKLHNIDCYPATQKSKARDMGHFGTEVHTLTTNNLKKILKNGSFTFKV